VEQVQPVLFADVALARRLESNEALNTADYARTMARLYPDSRACAKPVRGGYAVFTGPRFPINRVVGLGLHGPVTATDLDVIEDFYARRDMPPEIELCPLVDRSLVDALGQRRYRVARFYHLCVRPLPCADAPLRDPVIAVTPVDSTNIDAWALDPDVISGVVPDDPWVALNVVAFNRPDVTCFLTTVAGEIAGKGALAVRGKLTTLFSASTRPDYRRRGVQRALIAHRLALAGAMGCDLAAVTVVPGADSQRNLERAGFRIAYTKPVFTRLTNDAYLSLYN